MVLLYQLAFVFVLNFAFTIGFECNGMEGLCNLPFNKVTFAGSHNSASNGPMKHGGGLSASACWFKNQALSFRRQLDFGIRFFDIDTCYHKDRRDKLWTCHTKANREPLYQAIREISVWMNVPRHRNEVIAIRFHDTNAKDFTEFDRIFHRFFTSTIGKTGINPIKNGRWNKWPTLAEAINDNKRVFIFMSGQVCDKNCRKKHPEMRPTTYFDTWITRGLTTSCKGMPEQTRKKCKENDNELSIVSAFASYGLCLKDLQKKCNPHIRASVYACQNEVSKRGKTVNFITADYVNEAKPNENVVTLAKELNKLNIQRFS